MTALVFLAYDPETVKPGWIALIIVALLGLATFLLWRSMNTQLRKIQVPPRGATKGAEPAKPDDEKQAPDA